MYVDQVLQGKGSSNTGNVAKRLLHNPILLAETLELEEEFVIKIILIAFSSKRQIDFDKMESICEKTNTIFYQQYSWAKMRPTVHKYLKHGVKHCKNFKHSQAFYAEDAGEHMHKLYRNYEKTHARQNSRKNRLMDTFNQALYKSDPLISLIMINDRIKTQSDPLPRRVLELLLEQEKPESSQSETEADDMECEQCL